MARARLLSRRAVECGRGRDLVHGTAAVGRGLEQECRPRQPRTPAASTMAWRTGWKPGVSSGGPQRIVIACASPAREATTSRARRDLPIPASPTTVARTGAPERTARRKAARSRLIASSRVSFKLASQVGNSASRRCGALSQRGSSLSRQPTPSSARVATCLRRPNSR